MAIVSGREKPLANDGRAGRLRGTNSAADLFDKLKAGSAAATAPRSCIVASFVPHSRDYGGPRAAYDRGLMADC